MAVQSGEEMEEAMRRANLTTQIPGSMTPQAALVLDYLTTGRKLTPLVAHMTLGVASLTARIAELNRVMDPADHRQRLYTIQSAWEADHFNRRYKAYWMQVPSDAKR